MGLAGMMAGLVGKTGELQEKELDRQRKQEDEARQFEMQLLKSAIESGGVGKREGDVDLIAKRLDEIHGSAGGSGKGGAKGKGGKGGQPGPGTLLKPIFALGHLFHRSQGQSQGQQPQQAQGQQQPSQSQLPPVPGTGTDTNKAIIRSFRTPGEKDVARLEEERKYYKSLGWSDAEIDRKFGKRDEPKEQKIGDQIPGEAIGRPKGSFWTLQKDADGNIHYYPSRAPAASTKMPAKDSEEWWQHWADIAADPDADPYMKDAANAQLAALKARGGKILEQTTTEKDPYNTGMDRVVHTRKVQMPASGAAPSGPRAGATPPVPGATPAQPPAAPSTRKAGLQLASSTSPGVISDVPQGFVIPERIKPFMADLGKLPAGGISSIQLSQDKQELSKKLSLKPGEKLKGPEMIRDLARDEVNNIIADVMYRNAKIESEVKGATPTGKFWTAGATMMFRTEINKQLKDLGFYDVMRLAPTAQMRLSAEQASIAKGLIKEARSLMGQLGEKDLNIVMSRFNEFMRGTVGADVTDKQKFAEFSGTMELLRTNLMRLHFGARGGLGLIQQFESQWGSGKMNKDTLEAELRSAENLVELVTRETKVGAHWDPATQKWVPEDKNLAAIAAPKGDPASTKPPLPPLRIK